MPNSGNKNNNIDTNQDLRSKCPHCGGYFQNERGINIHISRSHPKSRINIMFLKLIILVNSQVMKKIIIEPQNSGLKSEITISTIHLQNIKQSSQNGKINFPKY